MKGSCFCRLLRVDLSARRTQSEEIPEERLRQFLGGIGLGASILYSEGGNADALSPENPLIFAVGPFNGTRAPGSGAYCIITRSPLTGGITSAQANGFFGFNLKSCGYDAIVITGRATDWVYLVVSDINVEIRDAFSLKGKDTWETEEQLKEIHGQGKRHGVSVACIGPAGENRVRFAVICSDQGHVAATGGVGAVMGNKNLKAIVVGGNKRTTIASESDFDVHVTEWRESGKNSPEGRRYNLTGTAGDFATRQSIGSLPVQNLSLYDFPGHEKYSGLNLRQKYKVKGRSCYSCHFTHLHTFAIPDGPYQGFVGEEVDYEDLAGWGSNLGINDPSATIWLNNLNDRLGMDAKEGTFTLSMAMECFSRGIIKSSDTGGIDLRWGNSELVATLLRQIAFREGFGNILAEGVVRAATTIGGEATDLAVYLGKGCAPHVHDVRNLWEVLFSQVISNTPSFESIHVYFNPEPEFGIPLPLDPLDGPAIARAVAAMTTKRQITDSLVICNFPCRGSFATILTALNAATGWDITFEEAKMIGRRIVTLTRLYNYSLGFSATNDDISARMALPPQGGLAKGVSIKPALPEMRRIYYQEMGWDRETGTPLPETVATLGLAARRGPHR
jgi:aldehyde:ferredoxin oxidoreductase